MEEAAARWRGQLLLRLVILLSLTSSPGLLTLTDGVDTGHCLDDTVHSLTGDWMDPVVWDQMLAQEPYWIYSLLYRNRTGPHRCHGTTKSTDKKLTADRITPGYTIPRSIQDSASTSADPWPTVPASNFTIVTALLDLGRGKWPRFRRKFENYIHYAVQLLQLNNAMVVFTEEKVRPVVEFYRRGKEHITKVVVIGIQDLELYREYDVIKQIMTSSEFTESNALLTHPEGFSPEYNILVNSKCFLLLQAARADFFQTHYFYWVDMGYGHGHDVFPRTCDWTPHSLMTEAVGDRITYIQINPVDWVNSVYDIFKQKVPPIINGGFFGGSKKAVESYYHLHKSVFLDLMEQHVIDDDQTLAIACYLKNPELFNLVRGTWYDAFRLFD